MDGVEGGGSCLCCRSSGLGVWTGVGAKGDSERPPMGPGAGPGADTGIGVGEAKRCSW